MSLPPPSSRRPPLPPVLVMPFGIQTISTSSILIRYTQGYATSLVIAAWRPFSTGHWDMSLLRWYPSRW